jgi:L-fucose mutarotase
VLKGIDPRLSAELVHVLMLMGHGDDIVVCDINHPAATIARETCYGRIVDMPGCDIPDALDAILSLMPLDDFVAEPVMCMQVVGDPSAPIEIVSTVQPLLDRLAGKRVQMQALERFDFYAAAKRSFAIVRTSDPGPYGCFVIRKGVVQIERAPRR